MKVKEIEELLLRAESGEIDQLLNQFRSDERTSVQNLIKKTERRLEKEEKERIRMQAMWDFEKEAKENGYRMIAGTDEVGRGPLAGPVVAAAVILPEDANLPGIKDSKKLSEKQREELNLLIKEQAVCWSIAEVSPEMIDEINILEASRLAMKQSVEQLSEKADFVLVDGIPNPRIERPSKAIVKGDNRSISIAAASIIAKVYRDHLMEDYDREYPGYGFAQNKGYPTESHMEAVRKQGACPIHRMTFRPLNEMEIR